MIVGVGSSVVFSIGFKFWESNVDGIYGRLIIMVTGAVVVVVVV